MTQSKRFWLLPCLCLLAGLGSIFAGQDASWDLQNYHLYDAFTLLHQARWRDFDFAQSQSFLNPLFDIPLALLDAVVPNNPRLVAFIMGLPFGVLAYFAIRLSRHLFAGQPHAGWASAIAIILGLTGSATSSQIGLSSNEILVAAFLIAALDVLLAAPSSLRAVALSGLLAGLATGGKLTAGPYAIGLAGALVVMLPARRLSAALATLAAAGLAGTLITGGFWMFHLWTLYGNPIFPYANQIFHSPWAGPYPYNDTRFFPRTLSQALFYPFDWIEKNDLYVTENPFADARLAAVLTLALLALAAAALRRKTVWPPPSWRALIVFWLVSYVLWEKAFSIYRYAIPLEITGAMLITAATRTLAQNRPAVMTAAAALLTLVICRATIYPNWGHISFQPQSIPLTLPPIAHGALVIATDSNAVSFVATAAPPDVTFIGVNNNFSVPDTTLTWQRQAATIATWPGPFAVIVPAAASAAEQNYLSTVYNIAVTGSCQPIRSAFNLDDFNLCVAQRLPGPSPYQPDISLTFNKTGTAKPYLYPGWFHAEAFGRWSIGATASLLLPTNPVNRHPLHLFVIAFTHPLKGQQPRTIDVLENGVLVTQWHLTATAAPFQATLPPPGDTTMELTFRVDDYTTSAPWGIGLIKLSLSESPL